MTINPPTAALKVKIPGAAPAPAGAAPAVAPPTAPPAAKRSAADIAADLGLVGSHSESGHALPKLGLWGTEMSGKTSLALSWPGPFVFNFDPNTSTIRGQASPVPYVQVRDHDHMMKLAAYAEAGRLTELVRSLPGFESYTVRTIINDSSTFQGHMVEEYLDKQTFSSARGRDDTRARYQEKLRILNRYGRLMDKAAEFKRTGEQYYIITTMHEKVHTDEKGNVIEVSANISGDYKRLIFQHNDITLSVVRDIPNTGDKAGTATKNTGPSVKVRVVPPSKFHFAVGDRLGGLGRYKRLPAEMTVPPMSEGGLYTVLCRHWGIEPEKEER